MVGGGTTYAVSLPKPWIEKQGLSAGDEVLVEARVDGTLIVQARKGQPSAGRERTITVGSSDASEVLRTVIGLYVAGFNTATLQYPSSARAAVRGGVADACERLHGVQVVEEHPSLVVLQDLADPTDFNMDKGLRRMHLLVLQILSNACAIIASGSESDATLRETLRHEAELDRLLILLMKQHNVLLQESRFGAATGVAPSESLSFMFVAQFLERIGDYAIRISQSCHFLAQEPSAPVASRVGAGLAEARELVDIAVRAFHSRDVALANDVIARALAFSPSSGTNDMFDVFTAPRSQPQLHSCVRCIKFFSLIESIERIGLYAKSIAETAINRTMASDRTPGSPSTPASPR